MVSLFLSIHSGTVWEGLPLTFASKFFVVYQGYLYIPVSGSYTFQLLVCVLGLYLIARIVMALVSTLTIL